ncbi:integrase [Acinetobacter sp. ACNIH3]|uniref:tyrosine-type recombinase/integrase n=1 Tax=unclassified Acinetobacter TaxID=196816 RepID=UPI000CDDD3FB|nr:MULTISPECIES: site-specific integrase [unclassified Acinetobacter]POU18965.1 integrase [Acinetobacter sp. ACNIH3]POV75656.1 integrase [Acinetobacter sp. ACNIH4]
MLTQLQIKALKPRDKLYKICDGDMLYIFTSPTGKQTWKVLYTFEHKKGTVTLGPYPAISIQEARLMRDAIKAQLVKGNTPSELNKKAKKEKLESITLEELLQEYLVVVTPTHKGAKQEKSVIKSYIRDFPKLMKKMVKDIDSGDIDEFRDIRLEKVSRSTVARDLGVLGGVFRYAIEKKKIIKESPLRAVSKPRKFKHRDRRITEQEVAQILEEFKYQPIFTPLNKKQQTAWAFLFAIETAMRAGEIVTMKWEYVFEDYVHLPDTKNDDSRNVPLSSKAKELLDLMKGVNNEYVCTLMNSNTLSQYFWQIVTEKLKIEDLRFHDTRHEATTRLAQKLPIQDLAKVTGHKDLKTLMRYYNPTASELAIKINS